MKNLIASTLPLFKVNIDTSDAIKELTDVFDSGYLNEGSQVTKLTDELSKKLGSSKIVLTNSCTSAITMALRLAGVGADDEVISTPMTCVATNMPIVNIGAKILWSDINHNNGMIDVTSLISMIMTSKIKITKKTKALIVVAWAGTPPELLNLFNYCKSINVKLILDAAHAYGATFQGKPIHEFAHYTCYSFQAIKHFTTGDGGALICNDENDYQKSKALKWFGLDRDKAKDEKGDWKGQQWDVDIVEPGYKFNMNNMAAAVGISNLGRIDESLARHRHNSQQFDIAFNDCKQIKHILRPDNGSSHWVHAMKIDPSRCMIKRDELLHVLNAEGIMAGVVHVPNDDYTAFSEFSKYELPGVRNFSSFQFNLPCGWWLNSAEIDHIAKRVIHHVKS